MDKENLYRFFSNQATVEEEVRVLDWLDEDPAHHREMLAERRLFDAMLFSDETKFVVSKRRLFATPGWAKTAVRYAAVVLLAGGVGGFYVSRIQNKLQLMGNTISVPAGQRVNVVLPDGTKVCMNARSELKYPAVFTGNSRRVKLSGEAFFDVVHDAKHPFVVETHVCDVEVLGTKFDVESHPESGEFVTSLIEGRVVVTDRNNPAGSVQLNPREQVHYRNNRLEVGKIPDHERFQWRDGLIAFRDASFGELIQEFEKYFGVHIETQRKEVTDTRFTGKIRISEGVDHALWALQQNADFKYTRNDTRDVIYIQ